ncbi:MoxR family ATPase [Pontibacter sp. SGAir0037]|uniref:AAA family ATPase n=1 Tax=Pontibacter sp. SGAir0037 TaxID=2571030 RepID=UPI0010CCE9E1|nr:MoxR family ATPase [Pontibacter sp. SGAir0037]QCR21562.1 ATPase [Pontibacter sp. SGAir0037]
MEKVVALNDWKQFEQDIVAESSLVDELLAYLKQTIVGQEALLERLLIGLFGNGHLLLEGVPGLAKTLAVKSLAQAIQVQFNRIQFTPDILPADILGTMIYNIHSNEFSVKKGPVFSNFVLADEINRAPEKVQSALLEVMQERQVTIGNDTYPLEQPFLVLATQNPVEQGGTYELPEAQMDRFMLKVLITYPSLEEERMIIRQHTSRPVEKMPEPALTVAQVLHIQSLVKKIYIDPKIEDYILNIIFCTRFPENYQLPHLQPMLRYGSSPRGSINLAVAARAHAFLRKRAFVLPEDIRAVVPDVLRHRIGLTYTARAESVTADDVIAQVLKAVPAP